MKTTHEHTPNEALKQLFKQLFEIQLRLERPADNYDIALRTIVIEMDRLMEKILDYTDE